MQNRICRYCGLAWPGDEAITLEDLRKGAKDDLPICIKAPPADRWFKDSGINGHMFDSRDSLKKTNG
jgi:hypothetical protein